MTEPTEANQTDQSAGQSIATAARALSISERTLRRVLTLAQFAGKTVASERHTATGRRRIEVIPPDLFAQISDHLTPPKSEADTAEEAQQAQATTPAGNQAATPASDAATMAGILKTTATPASADTAPPSDARDVQSVETQLLRDAVARLEAENNRLWLIIEKEQANVQAEAENTKAALAQLADSRREGQILLSAVATGKIALPAATTTTPAQPTTATATSAAPESEAEPGNGPNVAASKSAEESDDGARTVRVKPWRSLIGRVFGK